MNDWQRFQADFAGKKVLIFGLGLQGGGVQVANTLQAAGAEVRVTDQKSAAELARSIAQLHPAVALELGEHQAAAVAWADWIIKNPAVPYDHPLLQPALAAGKPVVGEAALALQYLRDRSIAVTGTRGKTTTSHLIAYLLKTAQRPTCLAGNIPGHPLLAQLPHLQGNETIVIEIPSFQIESLRYTKTSAHIAVITTLYPDHLNRYPNWEAYVTSKTDLFAYQQPGDIAVFQADREWSDVVEQAVGTNVTAQPVTSATIATCRQQFTTTLPGEHNWENIALAVTAVRQLGVDEEALQAGVATFPGVPFRLEDIGQHQGLTFINDTTSTTPVALEKALAAFPGKRFILIVGGASKNLPLNAGLAQKVAQEPLGVVLLKGEGQAIIESAWQENHLTPPSHLVTVESLSQAVTAATQLAHETQAEMVLFSPGFASFDWFTNEFDRGEQFNQLVRALPEAS